MVSSLKEQWSFLGKLKVQYLLIAEKAIGDVGTGVLGGKVLLECDTLSSHH